MNDNNPQLLVTDYLFLPVLASMCVPQAVILDNSCLFCGHGALLAKYVTCVTQTTIRLGEPWTTYVLNKNLHFMKTELYSTFSIVDNGAVSNTMLADTFLG